MTESILLQLLADVRMIMRAQTKPITHVGISTALSNTASAPHTRVLLRVVDIMVATGELVRDINAEGGRCTYTRAASGDARDTGKRLIKAFEFDLEEAAQQPAQQAAQPAQPVAESEPEPGKTVRARIINALAGGAKTRQQLIDALPADRANAIDSTLSMLRSRGIVSRDKLIRLLKPGEADAAAAASAREPTASIRPTTPPLPAAAAKSTPTARTAKKSSAVQDFTAGQTAPIFAGPITTLEGEITDSPARDLPPEIADKMLRVVLSLQGLGATLRDHANAERPPAPKPVADLDTKVAVLRKLAPMVAADISAVLDAVANDLQAMAVAA